jgi:hypothetical protein
LSEHLLAAQCESTSSLGQRLLAVDCLYWPLL